MGGILSCEQRQPETDDGGFRLPLERRRLADILLTRKVLLNGEPPPFHFRFQAA